MLCIPIALKVGSPRFLNFGILLRTELARFTRMIGLKSATILSGKLFTPTFSMHEKSEFLYWVADPSTEVYNSSMFLVHLAKLELLPRLGLKTPLLNPWVPTLLWFRIVLSGGVKLFRVFLSTCTMLHAAPITITFDVIFLSGDKLFRESFTRELSWTFVMRSSPMTPMTAGLKSFLTDNLRILSIIWVSSFWSLLGSTCLLESLIVSNCLPDS